MSLQKNSTLPNALAEISNGRDHIQTDELARAINRKSQSIRKLYRKDGQYLGLRPIKLGNKLLWSVIEIAALLKIEAPTYHK